MRYEWDEIKNEVNFNKHGVFFEEAQTIWSDPRSVEYFDPDSSESEDRYIKVGHSSKGRILLVVFCERSESSVIRLISARRATANERRQFEKGI